MLSPDFMRTTKRIIRAAAEVGFDEAGTRVVGSAWPAVKKMLGPLMDELDRRFPALTLADTAAAAKAAEAAADALDKEPALQQLLADSLQRLADEQHGMARLLAQADESLAVLGDSIDRGFSRNDEKLDAILARLDADDDDRPSAAHRVDPPETPFDALIEANEHNRIAIDRLWAGDEAVARSEIEAGRARVAAAIARWPDDLELTVALGFLEKTGAEADFAARPDRAVAALARAARCFVRGRHAADRNTADSAANGIANVYALIGDHDRAIRIGAMLFRTRPTYGPAIADYAMELEQKRKAVGDDPVLLTELSSVYDALTGLAADPGQGFPGGYAAMLAANAAEVRRALASATRPTGTPAAVAGP